jgi:hypothetical protein
MSLARPEIWNGLKILESLILCLSGLSLYNFGKFYPLFHLPKIPWNGRPLFETVARVGKGVGGSISMNSNPRMYQQRNSEEKSLEFKPLTKALLDSF